MPQAAVGHTGEQPEIQFLMIKAGRHVAPA
jgi:hypothetical protein